MDVVVLSQMMRWFAVALCALVVACSGGSNPVSNAVPIAPNARTAAMGALGPKLDARIVHLGRPHYFFNRKTFASRAKRMSPNASNYYGSGSLQYGGGPVEASPKAYLIFWGFASSVDTTADPDGLASHMTKFFAALPNSKWLNTVTQYYGTAGGQNTYIVNPTAAFTGTYYDATLPASKTYTATDVANELVKVTNVVGYDPNTNYIVVSPHGYTIAGFDAPTNGFCAYHTVATISGGKVVTYTVFPYVPDVGYDCGAQSVSNPGTLDGVSIVGGHEEAEAITDVNAVSGWIDVSGQEIADKCAWLDLQNTTFPNGQSYATQPLFSNATTSCVQRYAGGTGPTPTPSPTPPPQTNLVGNAGFETGRLRPWSTCHSKGRMPDAFATTEKPHSGKYDAYAGTIQGHSEPAGTTSVCQLVTLPANAVLTAWTRGVTDDFRPGVYQFARLYNTSGTIAKTLYRIDRNEKKWHRWTLNLSAYANGQYLLAFGIEGKADAHGRYVGQYIDDVSVAP